MADSSGVPHIDGLFDLACRSGIDIRPTLLRVLTDLYVQKTSHSAEEKAQYAELATRLLDSADESTRQAVANRLSGHPDAPFIIAARLGVATEPIRNVPQAPAEPKRNDLLDAFFAADSFERRLILTNLDPARSGIAPRVPTPAQETCRRLEAAALAGKIDDFSRIIESALLLPAAVADRIARDRLGEPIVIAARSLGMPADMLQRVLLFINPEIGQSVARVYELAALYDEISFDTAESMIAIWRGQTLAPRRPAHQPGLYDDEHRSARAAASTSRYRSARRTDALAARFKSSGR